MRLALGLFLVGGLALAATRAKDAASAGLPSGVSGGVALDNVVGCRCSIRVDAGTDAVGSRGLTSGTLVPYYYDAALGVWVESVSSLHCSIAAKLDGGSVRQYVCPDQTISARFGRVSCHGYVILGVDGGTGADLLVDGGVGPQPVIRTECWGPNVVGAP